MNNNDWWNRVCPICGNDYCSDRGDLCVCYKCQNCRNIVFSKKENISQELLIKTLTFFVHHDMKSATYFLGSEKEYVNMLELNRELLYVSPEQVEAWYPRTFAQKIDYILLFFFKQQNHIGDLIFIPYEGIEYVLFMDINQSKNKYDEIIEQKDYILRYLRDEKYIEESRKDDDLVKYNPSLYMDLNSGEDIMLTPKALARVDELQKDISNNKDVFVAMAFNDKTVPTREAIREGIKEAHFSEKFLDEIIHNQQIVPYMMRLIRECRFLIMDITDPNYGAYYEAGYALGLGKEVIITCSKEIFSKKDFANKLEEKALKPHFDIAQKQILVWENTADLTKQLKEWILELSTRKR